MARISNNSLYKSAMWSAFEGELEKLSLFGRQQQPYATLGGGQLSAQKEKLRTTGITSLGGAMPGAIGGGVFGSAIGASMGKGFGGSMKGALLGGALLGLGGGYMTMNATRKDPLVDTFKGTAGATPPPTRIS